RGSRGAPGGRGRGPRVPPAPAPDGGAPRRAGGKSGKSDRPPSGGAASPGGRSSHRRSWTASAPGAGSRPDGGQKGREAQQSAGIIAVTPPRPAFRQGAGKSAGGRWPATARRGLLFRHVLRRRERRAGPAGRLGAHLERAAGGEAVELGLGH